MSPGNRPPGSPIVPIPHLDPEEAIHNWFYSRITHAAAWSALYLPLPEDDMDDVIAKGKWVPVRNPGLSDEETAAAEEVASFGLQVMRDPTFLPEMPTEIAPMAEHLRRRLYTRMSIDTKYAGGFARTMVAELLANDPGPRHFAIGVLGIKGCKGDPEDEDARDGMARAVVKHLVRFAKDSGINHTVFGPEGLIHGEEPRATEKNGRTLLFWDDALATHLEKLGKEGQKTAQHIRERAVRVWAKARGEGAPTLLEGEAVVPQANVWELWLPRREGDEILAPRYLTLLAKVLWRDVVAPKLAAERRNHPGLVGPLFERLTQAQTLGGRAIDREDGALWLQDHEGVGIVEFKRDEKLQIPVADMGAVLEIVRQGAPRLGTVNSWRVLYWFVFEGHKRAQAGDPDFRRIVVPGGWGAIGERAGAKGGKDLPREIHSIVAAMAHLYFDLPAGGGNLLTYRATHARGQRRSVVELILGGLILPGYASQMKQLAQNRVVAPGARNVVPFIEGGFPPLVGRMKDYGPQITPAHHTLYEFRQRADELVEHGGVLITPERWVELANRAALRLTALDMVLEAWVIGGDDAPAFLELADDGNRYTLAPAHSLALKSIGDGGKRTVAGRKAGRKRAKRSEEIANKLGKPRGKK